MTSDVIKYRLIKSLSVKSHNSVPFAIMNSRQQARRPRRYLQIDLLNPLANFQEFKECCTSAKMKTNLWQFALGILNFCEEKKSQGTQTIDIDILEEINENASVDQISILVSNLWLNLDGHSKLKLFMLFFFLMWTLGCVILRPKILWWNFDMAPLDSYVKSKKKTLLQFAIFWFDALYLGKIDILFY